MKKIWNKIFHLKKKNTPLPENNNRDEELIQKIYEIFGVLPKSLITKAMIINSINNAIIKEPDHQVKAELQKINFEILDKDTLLDRYAKDEWLWKCKGKNFEYDQFYNLSIFNADIILTEHKYHTGRKLQEHYKKFLKDKYDSKYNYWPCGNIEILREKSMKGHKYNLAGVVLLRWFITQSPELKNGLIKTGFANLLRQGNYEISLDGGHFYYFKKGEKLTPETKISKKGIICVYEYQHMKYKLRYWTGKYWVNWKEQQEETKIN